MDMPWKYCAVDELSPEQRFSEIAEILALAIVRLHSDRPCEKSSPEGLDGRRETRLSV
ncbi:MAG: hypothetical protein RIC55_02310 [Pirellulaceae bacterium]